MSADSGGLHCTYHQLDSGIHEFIFQDSSKEALDQFFHHLEQVFAQSQGSPLHRYIVDITRGDREVSIVNMTTRFRRLETQFPTRAPGRTALLVKSGSFLSVIDGIIQALAPRRDETRFFPVEKREDALQWLLRDSGGKPPQP
jgi:hypothetical protein